jgi:hypothetical protein
MTDGPTDDGEVVTASTELANADLDVSAVTDGHRLA